jgi:hypothetical protein
LDAGDDLVGMGVEDEYETSGGADAPDFVALGVFAHVGDAGCDEDFLDGVESDEVDDGDAAIGGGDVGVEMQAGTEEGGAMFAEEDGGGEDEKDGEDEVGAEVFAMGHGRNEFTEERGKLTGKERWS